MDIPPLLYGGELIADRICYYLVERNMSQAYPTNHRSLYENEIEMVLIHFLISRSSRISIDKVTWPEGIDIGLIPCPTSRHDIG